MKPEFHCQVRLQRDAPIGIGVQQYICYVPEQFAVIGKPLDIKNEEGVWEKGWIVRDVFTKLPTAVVREREQDYKQTRKASDI